MFFVIAGIQPRTKVIDNTPRLCPSCGHHQAYLKRTDHYLSLFFIPLFSVKKGGAFLVCENCERMQFESQNPFESTCRGAEMRCTSCGRSMEKGFSFCPYCGKPL